MYIYIYIYTYTYTYTYVYTYIYIYIYIYHSSCGSWGVDNMYMYIYIHIYVYALTCMHGTRKDAFSSGVVLTNRREKLEGMDRIDGVHKIAQIILLDTWAVTFVFVGG